MALLALLSNVPGRIRKDSLIEQIEEILSVLMHNATTVVVAANSLRPFDSAQDRPYRDTRGKRAIGQGRGQVPRKVGSQPEVCG